MTDPKEALVAAIGGALCESFYSDTDLIGLGDAVDGLAPGDDIFGAMAEAILAALTPEARDKMLLGFALKELRDGN